jgi:outer membrane murein-binding lipoprotein Lpp
MKKLLLPLVALSLLVAGCAPDLTDELNALKEDVAALHEQVNDLQGQIDAVKKLAEAASNNESITDYKPIKDNDGNVIGYTIYFTNMDPIEIYYGKDGKDGQDGQNGKDGITPQLRINTTTLMWEVSLDKGETWTSLGVKAKGEDGAKGADGADGDAFFKSVTVGETEVTFTLADGVTTFTLPVMDTFKKVRDRVQSIVYIPENLDGMMTLQNGVQTTVRYRVMPEAVATALATNYASTLSFIGEEVAVTRGIASATIAIDGVVNEGNGRLAVSITPSGMTADKGYAFALTMNDGTSMYSTAYTSVFFAIPPVAIGIAADGILAGQGYITVGNTLQLIPLLVPTTTNMKGVEWTTSDANVATVDANGQVIARNNGTATITVTSKAAPTVSKSITITVSDGSITLNTNDLVSQSNAE